MFGSNGSETIVTRVERAPNELHEVTDGRRLEYHRVSAWFDRYGVDGFSCLISRARAER